MTVERTALFFAPVRATFRDLCASVAERSGVRVDSGSGRSTWAGRDLTLRIDPVETIEEARQRIEARYYNLVVADCRHLPSTEADCERQEAALQGFLDLLGSERDRERRYPFQRVVVLVGDEDEERVDRLIFRMGERHVGACLRDLSLSPRLVGSHAEEARGRLVEQLWSFCHRTLVERRRGKKALSVAGGGITGIYYELGVLKCLEDVMDRDLRELDLYFGISAGAVVTGLLANGLSLDGMIGHVAAADPEWVDQLRLPWRHLNLGELPGRLASAQWNVGSYLLRLLRGREELSLASLLGPYGALLAPMFDNTAVERFLRHLITTEGRSNRFGDLPARLFVGATDQDSRQHVLFGEDDGPEVTISRAIQASAAAHPYFRSVEIDGRYYTDGIITRTSNLSAAIRHGADLVFIVDPFLPLISEKAGEHARHGSLWLFEQDLKTLSYTRFDQVSDAILRHHPEVNAYTFVPSRRMRRLMSQNPFLSRNFDAIVCQAYRSTYRRLTTLRYKMEGELASHGITLDLDAAEGKVAHLEEAAKPEARLLLGGDGSDLRAADGSAA